MGLGLAWTSHHVTLCQARRRRGKIEVSWAVSTPLPAHSLVPSFTAPNLQDLEACEEALATTLARAGIRRAAVAVTLPDPSLRIRLLPEEPHGGTREERKQLIAWQLRDTLPFPPEQARVDYVRLSAPHTSPVLCLIASPPVVSQYEEILRRKRLVPIQIGAASLALWNLWEASSREPGSDGRGQGSLSVLLVEETHATLLAFAAGTPRFWRCLVGYGESMAALAQEVSDSLHTLTEEGTLPQPTRVLVHAAPPRRGEVAEILRRELDLAVEEMGWQGSLPSEPAVLPALGAALSV